MTNSRHKRQLDADAALAAIVADASALCEARLARVAGTHALCLDGLAMPIPGVPGVGCWTALQPGIDAQAWNGAVRASITALPFEDEAFCAVLVRFAQGLVPDDEHARALARVLAPHGTLLIADLHPRSLWHAGAAPGHWARALRGVGLEVAPVARCGAPWPRQRGAAGVPDWLVRGAGGAWLLEARRRSFAAIPLRKSAVARRVADHNTLLPGAHRQCA